MLARKALEKRMPAVSISDAGPDACLELLYLMDFLTHYVPLFAVTYMPKQGMNNCIYRRPSYRQCA